MTLNTAEAFALAIKSQEHKMTRFKSTDNLGNVAYIYQRNGDWHCALANGTPACLFYALGNCDEMAVRFRLDDAPNDAERLLLLSQIAGPRRSITVFK